MAKTFQSYAYYHKASAEVVLQFQSEEPAIQQSRPSNHQKKIKEKENGGEKVIYTAEGHRTHVETAKMI